ncbi:YciI family protein [Cellvibrio fibrivorans]|uniref:Glyoxalase superfamily protein PhnB n=1 Tax=Cellvibrio fibrivorans TaxID=126350 RepID=A0ABU1V2P2_9GAMM|nr:YciI family protein [Cellvibrio fibrivorans]MDR7091588.1 putative glyoxalase superfamily protein PhnB [Cellvibrio fibrivorans]
MKVMVIVKASPGSEAGKMPTEALMSAMMNFNEELVKAGIMESGDGLKPSSQGLRVRFSGDKRVVTTGPFTETNELIAGYWIWNVKSMEEAVEWVKKCPNPMEEEESDIEIRTFYEIEDFAVADPNGASREKDAALRQALAMQKVEVNNYLFFSGRCDEALAFYKQHLSADVKFLIRFNESPDAVPEGMLQDGFENKVMHAEFSLGNVRVMASDGCNDVEKFSGFRLALNVPNEDEARRIFAALESNGGKVDMPLMKTFWSPLYGQVTDQFGVGWMVMLPGEEPAQ